MGNLTSSSRRLEVRNPKYSNMEDSRVSLGFAFNDPQLSDRVLHLQIMTDSGKTLQSSTIVKVKTLHISSAILAGYSLFFFKLFKNGMRESQQGDDVTLKIMQSEEAAFMEVLSFMYNHTLSATTTQDLLDALIVADKFEVTSCMRYCVELLQARPMSQESALLYLQLPSSVLVAQVVQPIVVPAKKWLLEKFKDVNKLREVAIKALPLYAIEVVLDSGSLQESSSDDVFEFVLEWARTHYPKVEERHDILNKRLSKFFLSHFSYMSCSKLKEVLVCPEFDPEDVSKLVLEALFFKIEVPYGPHNIHDSNKCAFIKVEQSPHLGCSVYFDLKKEECESLSQLGRLYSPLFRLDERWIRLFAGRGGKECPDSLGLYVCMTEESESCTLAYEFAVMKKSSKEFQSKLCAKMSDKARLTRGIGTHNLLGIPWSNLVDKDNEYFIEGILHLRANLTIDNSQA